LFKKNTILRQNTAKIITFAPDKKRRKFTGVFKIFQMSHLTIDQKKAIFTKYGGSATNTGSVEAQVAHITQRISQISSHLQANKHDHSTQRGLMRLVGQRKRLLAYLQKHNLQGYRALIEQLGLRK
jgi:small subunit ribosomal protein S15